MKTKILAVILAVAMLVSMLPISAVVSAATTTYEVVENFDNLDNLTTSIGNNFYITEGDTVKPAAVDTLEGETVFVPASSSNRHAHITHLTNYPTDKLVKMEVVMYESLTAIDGTGGGRWNDNGSCIYLIQAGTQHGLAMQFSYSGENLTSRWFEYYPKSDGSGVTSTAPNAITAAHGFLLDSWITITATYDYSVENKITVKVNVSDGTTSKDYTRTVDFTATSTMHANAYPETFKTGIGSWYDSKYPVTQYYNSMKLTFEKEVTAADLAADFRTNNDYALDLPEINSSDDFDAVEAAIAEYETLGEDVKDLLSTEIAKLNFLMNDFDATCFKEEYAQVLELETVATNAQASAVLAAIAAYAELDDAVKALLTEQITKLNELKATIKITEFDFEDEALFNEVWESLPETGDIQTGNSIATSTQKAPATIVADSLDENNSVLFPEIRNTSRKRKILTVKENYLNEGKISSLSTDLRIDGSAENWDSTAGIYLYYGDPYNYVRLELWHEAQADLVKTRVMFGSGTSDSDLTTTALVNNANADGFGEKEWATVKADYAYSEEGTEVTLTITEKATNTVLLTKKFSVDFDMSNGKVGYGSASTDGWLTYFDNFALTYASEEPEVPVVTPEELAAEFVAANAAFELDAVDSAEDVALVDAMLAAYADLDEEVKAVIADEVAALTEMKAAYLEAKANAEAAQAFTTTYSKTLALEVITSDAEYEAVTQAIAAYNELDDAVKDIINLDVAKYEGMMNAYDAEKANKAAAAEYEKTYAKTFEITVITDDTELEAVDAAITAYKALDLAVQAFVTVDIAKYEGLVADYIAAKEAAAAAKAAADAYLLANEAALDLETIADETDYEAVKAAITAYGELTPAAQAFVDDAIIDKLNALKADYDEFLNADYTPVINGATIKRSGTQTLAFRCAVGAVNARKQVVDCGIIVTANSYIADGYVSAEDLTVDSTNELVLVAPLGDTTNITSGYEFTVNIGNISAERYGVRYVAKVFVKYSDGTVEYSETATKSVISVAKAIATWTFNNYESIDDEYGVGDIAEIIKDIDENGNITYAYDVASDNGVKILEYLENNNAAIATAYGKLNAQ